jgi:hypothetical protein
MVLVILGGVLVLAGLYVLLGGGPHRWAQRWVDSNARTLLVGPWRLGGSALTIGLSLIAIGALLIINHFLG